MWMGYAPYKEDRQAGALLREDRILEEGNIDV